MNSVFTFGCRLNFWESHKINQTLKKNGKNNLTVFNTCSVTNEAVKKIISEIKKFHARNPEVKIAVTGCAVETNHETFKNMKEVSFVINNRNKLNKSSWESIPANKTKKYFHEKDILNFKKTNPANSRVRKFV